MHTNDKEWQKAYHHEWRSRNKANIAASQLKWNQKQKLAALVHYSSKSPSCACCLESNLAFLTIDHINGNGTKHRKEMKVNILARWLVMNNFPEGYQVLCFNCNCGRQINKGVCPHVK